MWRFRNSTEENGMNKSKKAKCPECGTDADRHAKCFPFCSERCQMIDLGAWANEKYRIASKEDEDEDGDTGPAGGAIEH